MPALARSHNRRPGIGKAAATYADDVFINCPFDNAYRPILDALTFAVIACHLRPRCALEAYNGGTSRIDKIVGLIRDCRWGIHDISRTEMSDESGLPRFNMPLELGLFLGAHRFGSSEQREKTCLVLDTEPYRYQSFISDIAGQDVIAHNGTPALAIGAVRDWLNGESHPGADALAGSAAIASQFTKFQADLPGLSVTLGRDAATLTYRDYCKAVRDWLANEASRTWERP